MVWTQQMGANTPQNYQGYPTASTLAYADKKGAATTQTLSDVPCYDPATSAQTGAAAVASDCYGQVMRLAYLNQQLDGGSLVLRAGKNCLTQAELDAIPNKDVANFHPLNCAKLNAKPFPYFDGGIMVMRKLGFFSFFSSRNNNFSNRQQIGILCVGRPNTADCAETAGNILQDTNSVASSGTSSAPHSSSLVCYDANGNASPKACVYLAPPILVAATFAPLAADSDATGDGNLMGCDQGVTSGLSRSAMSVDKQVGLALGLLAVGIFSTWLCFFCYNRQRRQRSETWLKPRENSFKGGPMSANEDRIPEQAAGQGKKSGFSWDNLFGAPRPSHNFSEEAPGPDAAHVRAKSKVMGSIETVGQTRRSFSEAPMAVPPPPPPRLNPSERADFL